MNNKKELMKNIEQIHTTELGIQRIKRNLELNCEDVVDYCINILKDENSRVIKSGKNYYLTLGDKEVTINSSSFTIITAHIKK